MPTALDRDRNVAKVLNAAITCFDRYGIASTKQPTIASQAGVSVRSIERYFPSREALVLAMVDMLMDSYCKQMTEIIGKVVNDGSTGLECVEAYLRASGDVLIHHPRLIRLIVEADIYFAHSPMDGIGQMQRFKSLGEIGRLIEGLFVRGIADGSIKPGIDPFFAYHTLSITFTGMSQRMAVYTLVKDDDNSAEIRRMVDTYIDAVRLYISN